MSLLILPLSTDGEVIGNNISILIEKDGDQMSKMISRFIFAHEFFHLWNGKSMTPTTTKAEWFKEGVTNYYTLKSLHHVGFLNDDSFLAVLNNLFYQRYSTDEGFDKLSMCDVADGDDKHKHWGLIYGGGLFVGICQDMIIREETGNEKSLDDFMRALFKKYGGTDETYVLEEVINSMSELSGKDQSDFFNRYVIGFSKVPISEYLLKAGLDAKIENGNLEIVKKEQAGPLQKNMLNGLFGIRNVGM